MTTYPTYPTYIYIIRCPITGEVVYVGKTIDKKGRVYTHRACKTTAKISQWIQSIRNSGYEIYTDIIDECPCAEYKYWESFYIDLFRSWGFTLLNTQETLKPGVVCRHSHLKNRIKKHSGTISNFCRKYRFNYIYFNRKMQGRAKFTRTELLAIEKYLKND